MADKDQDLSGNGRLLARIDERTQRMDRKIDGHITSLKVMLAEAEARQHQEVVELREELCRQVLDHEQRIRGLEKGAWLRNGLAAVAGGVTGLVASLTR